MKIFNGKVLKVRPGHLANFSGGAGYMPFIIIFSVPASFICNLISNIIIFMAARKIKKKENDEKADSYIVALAEFNSYAKKNMTVTLIISLILSIVFFIMGISMVYSDKLMYIIPAIILSIGPIIAYVLSIKYLLSVTCKKGFKKVNFLWSNLIYFGLLVVFIVVGGLLV